MRRILIDYKKLSPEITQLLIDTYPYGYGDEDIIAFKNLKGEIIEAVEVRTEDTMYLVKIGKSLSDFIASFEDTINEEIESENSEEENAQAFALELETTDDAADDF